MAITAVCRSSNFQLGAPDSTVAASRLASPGLPKFLRRLLHCRGRCCSGGAPFFSGNGSWRFHHETWDPVTQNMLIINIYHIYIYIWKICGISMVYGTYRENIWDIYGLWTIYGKYMENKHWSQGKWWISNGISNEIIVNPCWWFQTWFLFFRTIWDHLKTPTIC